VSNLPDFNWKPEGDWAAPSGLKTRIVVIMPPDLMDDYQFTEEDAEVVKTALLNRSRRYLDVYVNGIRNVGRAGLGMPFRTHTTFDGGSLTYTRQYAHEILDVVLRPALRFEPRRPGEPRLPGEVLVPPKYVAVYMRPAGSVYYDGIEPEGGAYPTWFVDEPCSPPELAPEIEGVKFEIIAGSWFNRAFVGLVDEMFSEFGYKLTDKATDPWVPGTLIDFGSMRPLNLVVQDNTINVDNPVYTDMLGTEGGRATIVQPTGGSPGVPFPTNGEGFILFETPRDWHTGNSVTVQCRAGSWTSDNFCDLSTNRIRFGHTEAWSVIHSGTVALPTLAEVVVPQENGTSAKFKYRLIGIEKDLLPSFDGDPDDYWSESGVMTLWKRGSTGG
jgi:hypothetical protein